MMVMSVSQVQVPMKVRTPQVAYKNAMRKNLSLMSLVNNKKSLKSSQEWPEVLQNELLKAPLCS
jgi:hypothetical protein